MHRRSLIKCILGLAAAPKVLAEMDFKPPIVAAPTANLFKDLVLTVPDYMPKLLEKYSNTNWEWFSLQSGNWELVKDEKLQLHGNETKNT